MSAVVIAEAAGLCLAGIALLRFYLVRSWGKCDPRVRFEAKTIIITGGNSGIGKATAQELVNRGANVIIGCRNEEAALSAIKEIKRAASPNSGTITYKNLDLDSFRSVRNFAEDIIKSVPRVHVLINNAGVYNTPFKITEDGFEANFSTNHLGPSLLSVLLLPKLAETASDSSSGRIIFVSSLLYKYGKIREASLISNGLTEDEFRKFKPYADCKLMSVLFARKLAEKQKTPLKIILASPGIVYTNLGRHTRKFWQSLLLAPLAFCLLRTPTQGSQTILRCLLDDVKNGSFYRNCEEVDFVGPAANLMEADKVYNRTLTAIDVKTV